MIIDYFVLCQHYIILHNAVPSSHDTVILSIRIIIRHIIYHLGIGGRWEVEVSSVTYSGRTWKWFFGLIKRKQVIFLINQDSHLEVSFMQLGVMLYTRCPRSINYFIRVYPASKIKWYLPPYLHRTGFVSSQHTMCDIIISRIYIDIVCLVRTKRALGWLFPSQLKYQSYDVTSI